jgi:hypothetical protein
MPRSPFALILKVSDTYLPSIRLLINGMYAVSTGLKDSVQTEGMGPTSRGRAPKGRIAYLA